jgi:hypothetical protein
MAKRRDWRKLKWDEVLPDGSTVVRVKPSDSRIPPGHKIFGRRLEQLAGLLKNARKAHEDALHRNELKKTRPLPFKAKRDTQPRVSSQTQQQTAQAGATETSPQ